MRRFKGYPYLLGLTILFTLTVILLMISGAVSMSWMPFADSSSSMKLALGIGFVFGGGASCVVRKRFFTTQED